MRSRLHKVLALCFLSASVLYSQNPDDERGYALFEQPGKMVKITHGAKLSLYCTGSGLPTVVLESGFGGGTYDEWHMLQPRLAHVARTCSYDRAGYGFSELGTDLPRDIRHDVRDLHSLLRNSWRARPLYPRRPFRRRPHHRCLYRFVSGGSSGVSFSGCCRAPGQRATQWAKGEAQPRNASLLQLKARGDTRVPEAC